MMNLADDKDVPKDKDVLKDKDVADDKDSGKTCTEEGDYDLPCCEEILTTVTKKRGRPNTAVETAETAKAASKSVAMKKRRTAEAMSGMWC